MHGETAPPEKRDSFSFNDDFTTHRLSFSEETIYNNLAWYFLLDGIPLNEDGRKCRRFESFNGFEMFRLT